MNRLISLELHKLRTTPAAWVAIVITVLLGALSVATNTLAHHARRAGVRLDHVNHALSVSALTSMVMLSIGVIMVASEYRTRTIVSTFLATPQRARVLVAKLATVLGLGAVLGAVAFGLAGSRRCSCTPRGRAHAARRPDPALGRRHRLDRTVRAARRRARCADPQHRDRDRRRDRLGHGHRDRDPVECRPRDRQVAWPATPSR